MPFDNTRFFQQQQKPTQIFIILTCFCPPDDILVSVATLPLGGTTLGIWPLPLVSVLCTLLGVAEEPPAPPPEGPSFSS